MAVLKYKDKNGQWKSIASGGSNSGGGNVNVDLSGYATKQELNNKVDKVSGKQLSTEDFTTALKNKLNGLSNYNDTAVNNAINGLQTQINTLVSGDANTAIESFNEIIAFLDGVTDTQTLEGIIAGIEQQIAGKQDTITDLATIRSGAAKGATALQSHQDISGKLDKTEAASTYLSKEDAASTYLGKTAKAADATKADSATKATQDASGNVITTTYATKTELNNGLAGKVSTVSGKGLSTNDYTTTEKNKLAGIATGAEVNVQSNWTETDTSSDAYIKNKPSLATVATSGSYTDLKDKPTIPSAVTESTVSGWGFTKNTGTYSKPSTGIPKTDLASAVQTSLGKADTALQSYTEQYTGTYSKPSGGIPKSDLASAVQTSLGKADTALQSYTEQYKGTVTGVKMNGTTKNPSSGVVDLGTVITDVSGKQDVISDLATIREGASKGATALQSYTEKYTGTYSKPSTGIPKSDLASAVQTSLGKADSALQSYTETDPVFKASAAAGITSSDISNWNSKTSNTGTITGIKMNGASKGTSGVVDLGTVITSHQDISGKQDKLVSGTNIKTINGTSILGSGDISAPNTYSKVSHGTSDTTFTLTPNVFHVWGTVSTLTLTLGTEINGIANEYLFQFTCGTTATTLSLPSSIKWVGGEAPTIEASKIYQVSILNNCATLLAF